MRRPGGELLAVILFSVGASVGPSGCNALLGIDDPTLQKAFNECASGTTHCGVNAHCVDTASAFDCMCDNGYQGDGLTCTDIDECVSNPCDAHASCENVPGSFTCTCAPGYQGPGTSCTDIDECAANPCDAHATCANTPGSFMCTCSSGYQPDGTACIPLAFTQLATSGTCARAADGTIWCWGAYPDQNGNVTPRPRPVQAAAGNDWTFIDSDGTSYCGLRMDGSLWCWGSNSVGQLGDGSQLNRYTPERVNAAMGWKSVSVDRSPCGIQQDGSLWCWGAGPSSLVRQLTPRQIGTDRDWTLVTAPHSREGGRAGIAFGIRADGSLWKFDVRPTDPVRVGTATWRAYVPSEFHACGLHTDGTLWCSGTNANGEIGDGTLMDRTDPVQVGTATDWGSVATFTKSTCGTRGASRELFCWGDGQWGEIGDGTAQDRLVPTDVALAANSDWIAIGGSNGIDIYTCGLQGNGKIFCWGSQAFGAVGDGVVASKNAPVQVGTQATWLKLSGGEAQMCAILTNGALYCWGDNSRGMLGTGTFDSASTPQRVGTFSGWSDVSVSVNASTTCAIRGSLLWCWGANDTGQFGTGTADATNANVPRVVQISDATTAFSHVAAAFHVCAVGDDGSLWCWGDNSAREAADSDATVVPPTRYGSLLWKRVAVGNATTCAIRSDDTLWCWGANSSGEAGIGTATHQATPAQVGAQNGWTAVSMGLFYTCGIRAGTLYCWGLNNVGEIGDGTLIERLVPFQVGTDTNWVEVSAGEATTCARRQDNSIQCWGYNLSGAIGDGTWMSRLSPVDVAPSSGWTSIAAGGTSTCGVQSPGTLWCCGDAGNGALGLGAFYRAVPAMIN